jgi:prolyl-tRNA synthetase
MPLQVIVSERNLKNNQVEIKIRRTGERILVNIDDVVAKVREILEL